jgi:hypothetical protein
MGIVYVVAGIAALIYIGGPLAILFLMKINARPQVVPVAVNEMPHEVYGYFGETAPALQQLGYELVAYFTLPGSVANVTPYVAYCLNRRAGNAAAATVIYSQPSGGPVKIQSYLEFSTKMMDGMAVMTNNSSSGGSFKKVPTSDSLYAGAVKDPHQLHQLHLYRESILTQPAGVRFVPAVGNELDAFMDGYEYSIRRQVGTGYYRDAGDGVYRPTVQGAFAMTWKLLPPLKDILAARERSRVKQQLAAAQARPVAAPANVRISHESPYQHDPAVS